MLGDEPVDVFRLRNENLSRIDTTGSGFTKTTTDGAFALVSSGRDGVVLTQSGRTIATIDERTGKISLEDTSFQVRVTPATQDAPLQLEILSPTEKVVFSERIDVSSVGVLQSVPNFDALSGTGVFIAPLQGFSFQKNTASSPNLPEGGYLTDANHRAVAGVSRTGDIYLLDPGYTLSYVTKDSFILLRVINPNNTIVANVLYKISAEYILK